MRVVFTGEHLEPMHVVMELDFVPPIGSYVSLDGLNRYVDSVRFDPNPRKWNVDRQRWEPEHPQKEPWTVWVETRIGSAPHHQRRST